MCSKLTPGSIAGTCPCMPSSTVEDYVKQIYLAEQHSDETLVPMGKLAETMGVVPGTATSMIKTLAAASLVEYQPRAGVRLTKGGRKLALHILRRHRLVEMFLVETLGMEWTEVHEEAEALEHVISDKVLARIDALLGEPSLDPHGDPIPDAQGQVHRRKLHPLKEVMDNRETCIRRVSDQDEAFLRFLDKEQLKPGARVTVVENNPAAGALTLRKEDGSHLTLGFAAAAKLLVD